MSGQAELIGALSDWLVFLAQSGEPADKVLKAQMALESIVDMVRELLHDDPTIEDIVYIHPSYLEFGEFYSESTELRESYNSFLLFVSNKYGVEIEPVRRLEPHKVYLQLNKSFYDGGSVNRHHRKIVGIITNMLNRQRRDIVSVMLARLAWLREVERLISRMERR